MRKHPQFYGIAEAIALLYKHRDSTLEGLSDPWFKYIVGVLISAATEDVPDPSGNIKRRKFIGQRYWSKEAMLRALQNKQQGRRVTKGLIHEHVIEKWYFRDQLFEDIEKPTANKIRRILREHAIAAIITKQQDTAISKSGLIGRSRYQGIIVYDLKHFDWKEAFKKLKINFRVLPEANISKR